MKQPMKSECRINAVPVHEGGVGASASEGR